MLISRGRQGPRVYLEDQTTGKKSVKNEGASIVWRDVATMSLADGDESKSAEVT